MVNIDMNLTPLKVIGKEACLQAKGPFGLSKDLRPKRHPNILWRNELKKKRLCEGGRWRCAFKNIRWALHETTN
jgi:hypothetical protein